MKRNRFVRVVMTCVAIAMMSSLVMSCISVVPATSSETTAKGETIATTVEVDNRETETTTETVKKVSESDFNVKEYFYQSLDSTYCFLVIKNNSSSAVGISFNVTAFDKADNTIGADNGEIDILGPGEETIGKVFFDEVKGVDHVSYTMTFDETPYYIPVLNGLDVVKNVNKKNVVVSVTNKGDKAAEYVEAYALFFDKNGKLIGHESSYIIDADDQIKPGAKMSKQLTSYKSFKNVEVFLRGRATTD